MRTTAWSVVAVGLVLAGCGGGTSRSTVSQATPPSPPPSAASSPSATADPTSAPLTSTACTTADLTVTLGPSGTATGTSYQQLVLRNRSTGTCTLTGYLTLQLLDASGQPVGLSAQPTNVTGQPVTTVSLAPGGYANAALGLPDPSNVDQCSPRTAMSLRVQAPGQSGSTTVALSARACSTSQGRTQSTPVRAGRSSAPVA